MRFVLFGCIWDCWAELVQSSCNEVVSEFFITNTPDTPHWTLKLRFGAFHNIWVHSGPFGCLTKLGAKRAELVQKFVPQSRVGICRNEGTRSSPLDPKTDVLVRFVLFGCIFTMNGPDPPSWTLN